MAPLAVNVVLFPLQIVVVPLTATTGIPTTVTVVVAEAEQPPAVPVTV